MPTDGFVPRRLLPTDGATWPFGKEEEIEDFEALVRKRVSRVVDAPGSNTRVLLGIVVETRDGMTRDAEHARAIISECVEPNWRVRFLSGDRQHKQGPLTELSALFGGTRPIMRAARASGLVPGHAKDWIWSGFMILLAVLLSVAAGLVSHLAAHSNVYSGGAIGLAVGGGLLAALAASLKGGGIPVVGHPAMKRLEEAVTVEPAKTDADIGFGKRLVEELIHERGSLRELSNQKRNRAVVIDDYSKLWPRTMELVEQYIRTRPDEILGDPTKQRPEEFWVVFDKGSPPESERAQRSTGPISDFATFGSFLAWTCCQQTLDDVRKQRLVRQLERGTLDRNDRRLRYRRIGDIISGAKDATTEQELLGQLRDDGDKASVLSFAFMAVAASVPSPALLKPTDIGKTLSASGESSPDPLRDLLLAWFPELDRPGPLSDALKNSARTFAPLFEEREKHNRGVRVDAGWADAFTHAYNTIRREHDLPPADGAHAFWALYWRRRLTGASSWSAPAVESMIAHLRALREPASVSHRYGEHVARALCETALFGAHAALALCVPGIAPGRTYSAGDTEEQEGLVDCALALISEGEEPQDDALRESLFSSAWALYMLTGHRALLESISLIADAHPGRTDDDPLINLYFESLVRSSGGLPPLPDRDSPGSEAVQDHARVRALWLAALLEPLIRRGESNWLGEITGNSEAAMVEVIARAAARIDPSRNDLFDSLDYATLVVGGLWCTFQQTRGVPGGNALTAAFEAMGRTIRLARETRRRSSMRKDFVLKGLLQMLIAIVGTKPNDLADLHVMWRSLELNELADLSGLCCNVYAAADPNLRLRDDAKLAVGLGGVEDRPINIVESELLAGITRLSTNLASGATPIVEAGCVTIDAKLGEGFAFELSKLLVTLYLTIGYAKQELVLECALDPPLGHRGVLEVEDHELDARVTNLLNCVKDPRSAVAEQLAAAIASRRESIHSPWHEDQLDQALEYSQVGHTHAPRDDEELSALLTRWRTRIWEPGLPPSVAEAEDAQAAQRDSALSLSNASSPGTAEVLYVYEFPKSGNQLPIGSAQLKAYRAGTCYTYAYVLARIWDGVDRVEGAVLDDAVRLLGEDLPVTLSGYVMLANLVSKRLAAHGSSTSAAFERAIAIQRKGIPHAKADLTPITNHQVYSVLAKYDPSSRTAHKRHAEFWEYEEHRLSHEQLLLQIEGRHYFEVFWYHYSQPPEPPCDLDRVAVATPYSSLPSEVPEPLLLNESEEIVGMSGEFLRLGYEVFHRRPQQHRGEEIRAEISTLARRNVHGLYQLLMGRDTVTSSLRRLYKEQLKRFDELEP